MYKFNRLFYKTDDDGLLTLCFSNGHNFLYFDRGVMSLMKDVILISFSEYILNKSMYEILKIVENDDFDLFFLLEEQLIIKISFFPNDDYFNGVQQIFQVINDKDVNYNIFHEEIRLGGHLNIPSMSVIEDD